MASAEQQTHPEQKQLLLTHTTGAGAAERAALDDIAGALDDIEEP